MPLLLRPLAVGTALLVTMTASANATPPARVAVDFHQWETLIDFASGVSDGTTSEQGGLRIARPVGVSASPDPPGYAFARWTSPSRPAAWGATQLVPSWNAITPPGTWLQVEMRAHTNAGVWTPWLSFGRWASGDGDIQRTSIPGQPGLDVDTYSTSGGSTLTDYRLRVTLYRATGTVASPSVSRIGAMTSAVADRFDVPPSSGGLAWGRELSVPRYSQNVHAGHFPQYGGGGESWCSPTSTEMVIEYWGRRPDAADLSWLPPGHVDPTIDEAARATYDYAYHGTGNWPFNAAYAGTFGLDAHVTRLRSLSDAESYIAMGIPVITSQAFRSGEINGTDYDTDGHLMVIVGFTETGDVIVNDPASGSDAAVRHVYPRRQFENVWLRTKRHTADGKVADGSGGIAYIIMPTGHPRPS